MRACAVYDAAALAEVMSTIRSPARPAPTWERRDLGDAGFPAAAVHRGTTTPLNMPTTNVLFPTLPAGPLPVQ